VSHVRAHKLNRRRDSKSLGFPRCRWGIARSVTDSARPALLNVRFQTGVELTLHLECLVVWLTILRAEMFDLGANASDNPRCLVDLQFREGRRLHMLVSNTSEPGALLQR